MTKEEIITAVTILYPEGFEGFNNKLPTPRNYEEYVESVDTQNKKLYTHKYKIHSEEELLQSLKI